MKIIKYFFYYLFFIVLILLVIYFSASYYNNNIREIKGLKKYIQLFDSLFEKIIAKLPEPPHKKEIIKLPAEEKIEKIEEVSEKEKQVSEQKKENLEIKNAYIQNSFLKLKSNSFTINVLTLEKKYLLFYNPNLENDFQIVNKDYDYKIFINSLNKITLIKIEETNLIKNEIKIRSDKVDINDEIYLIKKEENDNIISLKSSIISKNNNFEKYKYINLYRIQGYYDSDFLGAYVFNKNYEFIGIAVYIQQSKSNNLYFIDNSEILRYIEMLDNLDNIKFYNLSFDFEYSDLLKIKNSKTHNFKDNNIILAIDGYVLKTDEEFQNLIYYDIIKQASEIKFNNNIIKKIVPDEKYTFFENEIGIYFRETKYGLEIVGAEKGNNFLKIKGLNIGDVLVSINNINIYSRLDFYLIRNLLRDKSIKKTLLFRTIRNTYVFFDI